MAHWSRCNIHCLNIISSDGRCLVLKLAVYMRYWLWSWLFFERYRHFFCWGFFFWNLFYDLLIRGILVALLFYRILIRRCIFYISRMYFWNWFCLVAYVFRG